LQAEIAAHTAHAGATSARDSELQTELQTALQTVAVATSERDAAVAGLGAAEGQLKLSLREASTLDQKLRKLQLQVDIVSQ
jgi:chaperonin GroEL (HSP60 family)